MGCTGTKSSKIEGNIERYHQEIFEAAQTGNDRRVREILEDLDKRKATAAKKEILNTGMCKSIDREKCFFLRKEKE